MSGKDTPFILFRKMIYHKRRTDIEVYPYVQAIL